MRRTVLFCVILVGFTAVVAQIVLLREFLIVFSGNEMTIGIILASWFITGIMGSLFLGRFSDRIRRAATVFSFCQLAFSIFLPLSVLAIRLIRPFLHLSWGELLPASTVFLSSLIILTPICALLGFLFSLSSKMYSAKTDIAGSKAGSVYTLESLGAAIGGILAGFLLVRLFTALEIMVILSLLNIAAAFFLAAASEKNKTRSASLIIFSALSATLILFWLFGGLNYLQRFSLDKQWQGYGFLSSENSIYGNVVVTENQSQRSFFYNGMHLYTVPNQQGSEEAVNFALLEEPAPRTVLLVGGGAGGLLEEILKHPVQKVDYLELDPEIIRASEKYLPENKSIFLKDPRVEIKNVDGRSFIKRKHGKYDCLILNLGDPYTSQLNRYYTVEFFRDVKSVLNESGVFSFALTSSESYMNSQLKSFLQSIYASLKSVFADVLVIPGDTAYFLACDKPGVLTYDYNILLERAKARHLDLKYVRDYYLFSKLSPQNVHFTESSLKPLKPAQKNYDFSPASYYYGMIFWASRFQGALLNKVFSLVNGRGLRNSIFIFCVGILLFGLFLRKSSEWAERKAVLLTVSVAGFTQMAVQVIILLSFQIIYGYLFYKLGILIAFFMAGLSLGGFTAIRLMRRIKDYPRSFMRWQLALCIYMFILPVTLRYFADKTGVVASWLGANVVFTFLTFTPGFIAGASFALANKIYLGGSDRAGQAAGANYSVDLFGSSLGALLTALFLIPILGIFQTCWALAVINLAVLGLLMTVPFKITSLE